MAILLSSTSPGFETCQPSPCGWLHCTVDTIWIAHLQITAHLEPMRREARLLLWDVDGSGREGWVDGRLCAQYASIDDFRGIIKCIPMRSNWWVALALGGRICCYSHRLLHACMTVGLYSTDTGLLEGRKAWCLDFNSRRRCACCIRMCSRGTDAQAPACGATRYSQGCLRMQGAARHRELCRH